MIRVFFAGDIHLNNGPSNVNKELFKYLENDFIFVKTKNKCISCIWYIFYTILCDVVVFSGLQKVDSICLIVAKILKKRIVYIMHGCVKYEQGEVNKTPTLGGDILEKKIFDKADLILCVSVPFSEWFKDYMPEYADKVSVLTNGVPWDSIVSENNEFEEIVKRKKIILLGGGRLTKANLSVVKAVNQININDSEKWEIDLYGYYRNDDDSEKIAKYSFVNYRGMISHKELLDEFSKATLFVQNSIFEPFSLACIEAITHNCSVLISRYVGCGSIMKLENRDMIYDPYDIVEIEKKIIETSNNSNYERLLCTIDKNNTSCETSANKLKMLVENLLCG